MAEDRPRHDAALAELRPRHGPFVLRLNRFFWSDREAGFTRFLATARRYTAAGYGVELQVRYHPDAAQEGNIGAWTAHVREVVRRFGAIRGVVALQIANEVNIAFSRDSSDGAYRGAREALVQGVIAAKDEARRRGLDHLEIGFNWAYRLDPATETSFWSSLRDRGGAAFVRSLDWIGLDAYPGTIFPPVEADLDGYRDGMVNAMSTIRCYAKLPGIPPSVPDQGRGERLAHLPRAQLRLPGRGARAHGARGATTSGPPTASATTAGSTCATRTRRPTRCSSAPG